jgi:hypothetical protein
VGDDHPCGATRASVLTPTAASKHSSFWSAFARNEDEGSPHGNKVSQRLVWHPHGSDNQVLADVDDLVAKMAELTNRTLRWRPPTTTERVTSESSYDRTHNQAPAPRRGAVVLQESPLATPKKPVAEKHFSAFISYHREEAKSDARFLQARPHGYQWATATRLHAPDASAPWP